MSTTPLEIEKLDAGRLRIRWDDGHDSVYTFALLRSRCPCASCSTQPRRHPGLMMSGATTPTGLEPVGRYAIQITWQDGHANGIYSFDDLRAMCPCAVCSPPTPSPR